MTLATLSLHSQRTFDPQAGEATTGDVFVGIDVDSPLNSALRFAAPADIAGATINSVTLTIRAKAVELTGGPLVKFAIAANTGNLASQNLASTAESNHDFLHTDTFEFGNDPVPADSEKVTSTYSSYTLDLTASAIVANMEDDIIVLCQHSLFTQMLGDSQDGHIVFDGVGGTSPATLQLDYTPVAPSGITGVHDGSDAVDDGTITGFVHAVGESSKTDDDDGGLLVGSVAIVGESSSTDTDDTGTAVGSTALSGSSDSTDADDVGTAEGTYYPFTASSSATDENDSGTATGDVSATGSSSGTDDSDTGSHVGSVLVSGTSTGSDDDDTGTAVGEMFGTFGDSNKSDANDTGSAVGEVSTVGSSSKSDGDDTGNAEGNVFGTFGQSSTTDATDGGTATGQVQLTGSSTTTDADDTGVATATNETFTRRGFMPQGMFIRSRFTSGMNIGA